MILSQYKLEVMASELLRGEEISLEDDCRADYSQGKAMSRVEEYKASKAIDKPYKEYKSHGFHSRSWKEEDYSHEEIEMNDIYLARKEDSEVFGYIKPYNHDRTNQDTYKSYMDLSLKKPIRGIYNPIKDNSISIRGAKSFKFVLSDCHDMKPQWNMYLYKNDYISACIRIDRMKEEYQDREKVRLSKIVLTPEQKATKAKQAKARRAKAKLLKV